MMLAGFETPTAGEIQLAGRSINNVPPHKRDIGQVQVVGTQAQDLRTFATVSQGF